MKQEEIIAIGEVLFDPDLGRVWSTEDPCLEYVHDRNPQMLPFFVGNAFWRFVSVPIEGSTSFVIGRLSHGAVGPLWLRLQKPDHAPYHRFQVL